MKYFNNINSLSDLKTRYRKLALELHPDRGGDEDKFKDMSAEFSLLYEVWKNRKDESGTIREENRTEESYNDFTNRFYREQKWTGSNRFKYSGDNAKIVADVRQYAKLRFPQFTFSITQDNRGSWTSSINVNLMQSPYKIYPTDYDGKIYAGEDINYHRDKYADMTPEVRDALFDVWGYLQSFNYDYSDAMMDYFDRGFYGHLEIGKHNNPCKIETNRKFRTGGDAPKEFRWKDGPAHAAIRKAMRGNEFGYVTKHVGYDANGKSIYKDDIAGGLYFGNYGYYNGQKHFTEKEYSQPSIAERVKEKLAAVGVEVVREARHNTYGAYVFSKLRFVGYTPEIETALAAEDKAKEDAYKAFLAKQNEPRTEKPQKIENAGNIIIEDYSERAIAVFGETKRYAEMLKNLGGRFNRNLRGRAGWIFSKKHEKAVREVLTA